MKGSRSAVVVRGLVAILALATAALFLLPREATPSTGQWLERVGLTKQTLRVGGFDIRYVRKGHGDPLILIHGLVSNKYTWADVIGPLSERFDVLALDLPGFGDSTQPGDLSFADLPKAVLGFMDGLGLAKAHLAGNSLGGAVTLLLAERHPERVDRIVVIDSAGFGMRPHERPFLIRLIGSSAVGEIADRIPVKRMFTRAGLSHLFHDESRVTDERVNEYLAPLLRPGALASAQSLLGSPVDQNFANNLAKIAAPTLIIWGRYDPWLPESHADRFVAAIKGARKVVVDAGHLPQEERPADIAKLIAEHLVS